MSRHFEIAVIGSGPGGYIAALKAAQMGARTAVIEKNNYGGTCLNYGCIPSKALLASAELMHRIAEASSLGVKVDGQVSCDWQAVQKRKDRVLIALRGGIKGLFAARNVTVFQGRAAISGHGRIDITDANGRTEAISAGKTILAVGSIPVRIPGWPDDPQIVCTSDEALHWESLPKRLLIVGGGVIGCEFACMMKEYGLEVTVVEMLPNLLPEMETQLGAALQRVLTKRRIDCITGAKVEKLKVNSGEITATIIAGDETKTVTVDKVLVATGRRPDTADIGLDRIGLETDRGFIRVNNRMETAVKDCRRVRTQQSSRVAS